MARPVRVAGLILGALLTCPPARAEGPGLLPVDPEDLIRLVVASQRAVEKRLAGSTYDLCEVRTDYAKDGRPKKIRRRLFYVLASETGRDPSRQLVEVDGRPATPEEVREAAEEDAKRRRVEERAAQRASSPPGVSDDDKDPLLGERRLSDLISRFDLRVVAEEVRDGRPVYVLTFASRPDAPRKTLGDRALAALEGRVLIDATDFQILGIDAHLTRNLKVAGGLAANVKGIEVSYRSYRRDARLLFPCAVDLRVAGKAALFFRLDTGFRIEFANLRTFRVDTEASVGPPAGSPEEPRP